ncbi:unnamed protein product [Gordionus sp. m RMFG-2023]|uniref:uncharacterized protein LOC135928181 n=1 Tax=Gordionus sp. m RMFG-2023 TaxID=3053472 RepID=UPI0030E0044B
MSTDKCKPRMGLIGPWNCYLDGYNALEKYLLHHSYTNENETTRVINQGTSPQLFIVFGSGPHSSAEDSHLDHSQLTYWCPDVRAAMPNLETVLSQLKWPSENTEKNENDARFDYIYCSVGTGQYWKDQNNPFRVDGYIGLKRIPSLFHWGSADILEEANCNDPDIVRDFIEKHLH